MFCILWDPPKRDGWTWTKLMVLGELTGPWEYHTSNQLQLPFRQSLDHISLGPDGSASITDSHLPPWPTEHAYWRVKQEQKGGRQ